MELSDVYLRYRPIEDLLFITRILKNVRASQIDSQKGREVGRVEFTGGETRDNSRYKGYDNLAHNPGIHGIHDIFGSPTNSYRKPINLKLLEKTYDNTRRNLNKYCVILATENTLTTKVTCEFLVNTVLPLICC